MIQDVITGTAVRPLETGSVVQQYENLNRTESRNAVKTFSPKVLDKASKEVNKALKGSNTRVEFSVYKPTHEVVVTIKDNETGKVLREIPSKKDLEMAAYMKKLAGIIVDTTV